MNMKQNLFVAFALLMLLPAVAWAKPRTKAEMKKTAASAINLQTTLSKHRLNAPNQNGTRRTATQLRELKQTNTYTVFGYTNGGFAVISADDLVPEVLGVSEADFVQTDNPGFNWWLKAIDEVITDAVKNNKKLGITKPDPNKYKAEVPTMVTTLWGQQSPYNKLLPNTKKGHIITGCVATATAQVLNYFKYPLRGVGSRTLYYPANDTSGDAIVADFGNTTYDWANMKDDYSGTYTEAEANAVATLMLHCGVASNMEYGTANVGSSAFMNDCAEGLRNYFGFAEAEHVSRVDYNTAQWMDIVFTELSNGHPLIYGGVSPGSMGVDAGHAFVIDGYNKDGLVSVNWGWNGDVNGYYNIDLLNPGNMYSFTHYQDIVRGIHGKAKDLVKRTINLPKAGVLADSIPASMRENIGELTLKGDINGSDFRVIREMAGSDYEGKFTQGALYMLDIKDARIVSGSEAYLKEGQLKTSNDNLPERVFYGCNSLRQIVLPSGMKTIADGAFAFCRALAAIDNIPAAGGDNFVYDGGVFYTKDRKEIISVIPSMQNELVVADGITSLHSYALAGCIAIKRLVLPTSVTYLGDESLAGCSTLSEIKIFSTKPPKLGKNPLLSSRVNGILLRVPIDTKKDYRGWGGIPVKNIKEFGSIVTVRNTIREYGDANPKFGYTIRGEYFEGRPEITCQADKTSPVGKYDIHIDYGTIKDKTIKLVGGILTIDKATLTVSTDDVTRQAGAANPEFVLHYRGFVNSENESVLTTRPTATTTANESSPVGEYDIIISGGEAKNYKFTYKKGKLTVAASTGIAHTDATETTEPQPVYTVSGTKVGTTATLSKLPAGVYIVNKKKVVVK
ncbi:C10 family peptidase [Prevotella aurantiaca]|uniref:C10 family peptidase n=1 Tax=Prevotella aurantiaca TaxID=596085 RepID=UPI001CAC6AE6|nr:C10 family peptidase [Prevotella aurantiaca]MBF1386815.1 C10 family peptidase [Prevotella aurantiaca]